MSSDLPDDRYKHDLFIDYYDYNCFQTFYTHPNKAVNYKNLHLINFLKMSNFHLQNDL